MTRGAALALAVVLVLAACSSDGDDPLPTPTPSVTAPPASSPVPTAEEPTATAQPPEADQAPEGDFFNAASSADSAVAQLIAEGRDEDAALIQTIASQPTATWLGDWQTADVARNAAKNISEAAHQADQIAVLVIYAIPGRDCGLHSAGGLPEQTYLDWVQAVADGIADGGAQTWVILEPDALAQLGDCEGQGDRVGLLRGAAHILADAGADVFLDAGNSNWRGVDDTVQRITQVGTEHLRGFSTNVSNYHTTDAERAWGEQVAAATGLQFVIDTSRNGNGSDGQWCNPRGRALGEAPALTGAEPLVATLWIKAPGESDGSCNGGPPAGQWWMSVALELARNA